MEDAILSWNGLKGSSLESIQQEDQTLRLRFLHPELAGHFLPASRYLLVVLLECNSFVMQPFANQSVVLTDLGQICKLELTVEGASARGQVALVQCRHKGASHGATLRVQCRSMMVMTEEFDLIDPADFPVQE